MAGILLLAGCSTTKHLPEGEILYTGQKKMIVENRSTTPVGETAMEEVEAALATAPNNSLLGSSTIRIPFPMGLWIYNGFVKYEKGFGRWIFNLCGKARTDVHCQSRYPAEGGRQFIARLRLL